MASYAAIVFRAPYDGSKPLASQDPLLHETMILFDDVVEVGRRSAAAVRAQFARFLQLDDRGCVCVGVGLGNRSVVGASNGNSDHDRHQ